MIALLQLCQDYFINHEIRLPIKQPGFNGKYVFFVVAHVAIGAILFFKGHPHLPKSLTWLAGKSTMNELMYFLLNMGIFNCHVLVFRGVDF